MGRLTGDSRSFVKPRPPLGPLTGLLARPHHGHRTGRKQGITARAPTAPVSTEQKSPMKIHPLITTTAALSELCARLAKADFVCVDTEFMRENTYWPELCLIQIADDRRGRRDRPQGAGAGHDAACSICSSTTRMC